MSIQQSFNQGLMGTTFLLGQTPGFKQMQERAQVKQDVARDEKTLDIIEKRVKNTPKGSIDEKINDIAINNLDKQVDAKIHDISITSKDPRIRANTILLDAKSQYNEQAKQTAANDLEKRMSDNDIVRSVVKNLRGKGLSGNQVKKVLYAVDKSEKEIQNGTNKQ